MNIKALQPTDRPRERLKENGVEALSDAEVLAVLLQKGSVGMNAVEMSQAILAKHPLRELSTCTWEELCQVEGVGEAKAMQILACFELGRRSRLVREEKFVIRKPEDVYRYAVERIGFSDREKVLVLYLDSSHSVIGSEVVSIGVLNASLVHAREVFKNAIKKSAFAVIVVHNHPSGNVTLSREDKKIHAQLTKAGELIGVKLLDFVVVGQHTWTSQKHKNMQ